MRTLDLPSLCRPISIMMAVSFSTAAGQAAEPARAGKSLLAFVGTYTGARSKGIYATRFDPQSGAFSSAELAAEVASPSFLAVHPNSRWLYAVNETENFGGKRAGAVSAFSIDRAGGNLTLLNQQPSGGTGPCHLSVDKTGKCLLVANYGSGSVAAYPIGRDGRIGPAATTIQNRGSSVNPQRQSGPHAHQILPDPGNRFALCCDLGLDQVLVWRFTPARALLSPHEPPAGRVSPGSGPRHLVFHPDRDRVYTLNELTSTLTSFSYSRRSGALTELCTVSTLPEGFDRRNSAAEVQVHPSGKYVYTSNRGEDSIAIFQVDQATGIARYAGRESARGKTPRHFAIDSAGRWLIVENQDSDNIVSFRIDENDGSLKPTGHELKLGAPVCLVFVPGGK